MATHAYLFRVEDNLPILTGAEVTEAIDAFEAEGKQTGYGRPYHENRDCWGTIWLNAMKHREANPNLNRIIQVLDREFKR